MKKGKVRGWAFSVLEAAAVVLILFYTCWPMSIDGESMENTLHTYDRVVMSRTVARFGKLDYGDIVVLKLNQNDVETENVIKRIVGLPNDRVTIAEGRVYINNTLLEENYLFDDYTFGDVNIVLESDEYYVLGDNRGVSLDSRETGAVTRKNIIGKVLFKIYPFSEVGRV